MPWWNWALIIGLLVLILILWIVRKRQQAG